MEDITTIPVPTIVKSNTDQSKTNIQELDNLYNQNTTDTKLNVTEKQNDFLMDDDDEN